VLLAFTLHSNEDGQDVLRLTAFKKVRQREPSCSPECLGDVLQVTKVAGVTVEEDEPIESPVVSDYEESEEETDGEGGVLMSVDEEEEASDDEDVSMARADLANHGRASKLGARGPQPNVSHVAELQVCLIFTSALQEAASHIPLSITEPRLVDLLCRAMITSACCHVGHLQ
jgi:hypothetical protein